MQKLEQTSMIEDKKRRAFLVKLLSIPAALLALENEELLRGEKAYLQVNDDPMAYLENAMILRFEAHKIGGASTSSLGLNLWMNEVARFVTDAKGTEWQKRALAVQSMSYLLQGNIAHSMRLDYDEARWSLRKAYRIARELADPELMALALHREGVVLSFSREGKHQDAIICLKEALDKINGHGFPYLKGYILKMLSQAYARTGQSQECWRSLGFAESVLSQFTGQPERSMFIQREFSLAAIIAQKGVNAAMLKDYDRAIGLIDKGLTNLNPTFVSTRTRLTIQKAEAYNGLEEIDSCVSYAEEALTLARSIGSKVMIARVENLTAALMQSKWNKEPGVRRLGTLLTTQ
jgi:tetratricopeptide (TPR) repeat protein